MIDLPARDDYEALFASDTPLLDVRAPVEFAQGAFPGASNLPLINDTERHQIGLCYKQRGQAKAVELGHQLVSGEVKAARVDSWLQYVNSHPQVTLYCFRGGMRSKISQRWIYENSGIVIPRVKGGYKAMRRYLLSELEMAPWMMSPVVLSGRTGVGKTALLQQLQQRVDLEAIFRHRGSAFGRYAEAQPSQIDVENTLAIALIKLRASGARQFVLEDESGNIGSRRVPISIASAIRRSSLVILEANLEERVANVYREYIISARESYRVLYGVDDGDKQWAANLLNALERIQRRLGGQRYQEIHDLMSKALRQSDESLHRAWIENLLINYYDPMYDYQIAAKQERVIYRGPYADVLSFLRAREQ